MPPPARRGQCLDDGRAEPPHRFPRLIRARTHPIPRLWHLVRCQRPPHNELVTANRGSVQWRMVQPRCFRRRRNGKDGVGGCGEHSTHAHVVCHQFPHQVNVRLRVVYVDGIECIGQRCASTIRVTVSDDGRRGHLEGTIRVTVGHDGRQAQLADAPQGGQLGLAASDKKNGVSHLL